MICSVYSIVYKIYKFSYSLHFISSFFVVGISVKYAKNNAFNYGWIGETVRVHRDHDQGQAISQFKFVYLW